MLRHRSVTRRLIPSPTLLASDARRFATGGAGSSKTEAPPRGPDWGSLEYNPFRRMDVSKPSMQEQYWGTAPSTGGVCYGCGPANDRGLHLRSFVSVEEVLESSPPQLAGIETVARFKPAPHHHAFPDVLNGGIIATLLDCHCNILAAYYLMRVRSGFEAKSLPTLTVTSRFEMDLKRPTPMDGDVFIWAAVNRAKSDGGRVWIDGRLYGPNAFDAPSSAAVKPTALCGGRFVAVSKH